jgi:lia operon protein LiaG
MRKLAAIALVLLGIGVLCAFFVFDKDDIVTKFQGETYLQEKSVDSSAIRSIKTETDTFNVTLTPGTSDDIKVRLEGDVSKKLVDDIIFTAIPKGDTLYIVGDTKDRFSIGISIVNLKMTVELPAKLWDSINIETDTGNIVIDQLEADKLNLKSDTGNLKLSNYVTKDFVFKTDTGNITLTDGKGSLKGETDTGNVRVESDELLNNIAVKTDTGNIIINVDKDPVSVAINIKKDTGNTNVEWDGFSFNKESDTYVEGMIGSGDIKIDLESDTGNFKLGNR